MREAQSLLGIALDEQVASMHRSMMPTTQSDHVCSTMIAPFGAERDVMDVEVLGMPTPRNDTTPFVTGDDIAARCRRRGLAGSGLGLTHVGRRQLLGITGSHLHHLGWDFHLLTAGLLPAPLALTSDCHSDLVAGATLTDFGLPATVEALPRHHEQGCFIIERVVGVLPQAADSFAKGGIGFGGDFQS